jgi:hypothetical protein
MRLTLNPIDDLVDLEADDIGRERMDGASAQGGGGEEEQSQRDTHGEQPDRFNSE